MAMALSGNNRHYHWNTIQPRHFISTAEQIGFNTDTARRLFNEMIDKVDNVVTRVRSQLPEYFPESISAPIFNGMMKQRGHFL